jgi:hypothetical protein
VPHVRPCAGCAILSDWYLSNGLSSRPELLIPAGKEKRSGGTPSRNAPHRARQGIIGICQCGAGALARGILKRPLVVFDRIKRQRRLLLCRWPCFRRFLESKGAPVDAFFLLFMARASPRPARVGMDASARPGGAKLRSALGESVAPAPAMRGVRNSFRLVSLKRTATRAEWRDPSRNAPHRARQGIIGICQCGAGALARGILKRPFVVFDRIKRQRRLLLCR